MITRPTGAFGAELCCSRVGEPAAVLAQLVRPAVEAARDASLRLGPLGLVADVALLLASPHAGLAGTAVPRLDLGRYDDRVVGPLVVDRRRPGLTDAYAALSGEWRGLAVALLCERLADDLEPQGPWWEPGALRAWLALPPDEAWDQAVAALGHDGVRAAVQARLTALASAGPSGFGAADVHLVEHLPALASRAQRLAVRQVVRAASVIGAQLPRVVRPRARAGPVLSRAHHEDRYPTGGFAGLTTSGSPENLVASELVYMESGADIDLFDVRYAEGELLYYTRDESTHLRRRRAIHVALAPDLVRARVKDPEVPWQRLVYALAVLRAVLERVIGWLGHVDLEVYVHALDGPGRELDEEVKVLELVLRTWVEAGTVVFQRLEDATALRAAVARSAARGETDVVHVSAGARAPELPTEPWALELTARTAPQWLAAATALARHLA